MELLLNISKQHSLQDAQYQVAWWLLVGLAPVSPPLKALTGNNQGLTSDIVMVASQSSQQLMRPLIFEATSCSYCLLKKSVPL